MQPSFVEFLATLLFALAVLHTFLSSQFQKIARRFREGSVGENFFHLLGEVETVFGLWAGILVALMACLGNRHSAVRYVESLNFTEPAFVFVIMTVAATRPVIALARRGILFLGHLIPLPREMAAYFACLFLGPLLGSFITEPAAMTVTALILRKRYYERPISARFMYITLAVLFVNVSIGGVLTPYAAPPVLMVASKWGWGLSHMLSHFGYKSIAAVAVNALGATLLLKRELKDLSAESATLESAREFMPWWMMMLHVLILVAIVMSSHHLVIFMGVFLFFLGIVTITREYQEELKLRQSLLVGFFLAGLVVLGGLQSWWLAPAIQKLNALPLFLGATALTSITDNAALTYLGSLVPNTSHLFEYALVAGSVAGGGLTVIANAPNPAGYSILQDRFGEEGISPLKLLTAAALPTLVAMACLWLLPSLGN
jgi:Na+/H+ antiporter NhaD/arsenite permease-like protein